MREYIHRQWQQRCAARPSGAPRFGIGLLVVLLGMLATSCALAQDGGLQPTPTAASRYAIAPVFEPFYQQHGQLRLFGYPLTNPYQGGRNDRLIQYFQRMRLEYDPEEAVIHVTPLGQWAVPDRADWVVLEPSPSSRARTFAGSEFSVRDEFLVFYEQHGGPAIVGLPLTPQLDEGGVRVQYFTNARLEWHPDVSREHRVQVAMLGEAHYQQIGLYQDTGRSRVLPSAGLQAVTMQASVAAPILFDEEQQVVHALVFTADDQTPVAGVPVELTATFDGHSATFNLPPTDGFGHAQAELSIPAEARRGQRVQLTFKALNPSGQAIGQASHSFKLWW